jgi:glycogen phosphorylase
VRIKNEQGPGRTLAAAFLEIIYRIYREHLAAAKLKNPSTSDSLGSISLIDEHNARKLRMGHLALVGSH